MSSLPNEVELLRVQGWIAAETIIAALRGSGIPARAHGEAAGWIYGITLDGLGEVTILVSGEHLDEARRLLEAAEQGQLDPRSSDAGGGTKPDDP